MMTDAHIEDAADSLTVPQRSTLCFPNKVGRIILLATEEVMGSSGINAVLNLARLKHLIGNYPPNNFDNVFSFDDLGRLLGTLDNMYGTRAGRGLALRIGRACFKFGVRDFGPVLGMTDLAFRVMPMTMKLQLGFEVLAETFNKFTDHGVRLEESDEDYLWINEPCGVCWGRRTDDPCCHLAVGLMQEALYWVSGGKSFLVEETTCVAAGADCCTIRISKQPID